MTQPAERVSHTPAVNTNLVPAAEQPRTYEDLLALGSTAEARKHGKLRSEGKTYTVRDGDVLEVLFSR